MRPSGVSSNISRLAAASVGLPAGDKIMFTVTSDSPQQPRTLPCDSRNSGAARRPSFHRTSTAHPTPDSLDRRTAHERQVRSLRRRRPPCSRLRRLPTTRWIPKTRFLGLPTDSEIGMPARGRSSSGCSRLLSSATGGQKQPHPPEPSRSSRRERAGRPTELPRARRTCRLGRPPAAGGSATRRTSCDGPPAPIRESSDSTEGLSLPSSSLEMHARRLLYQLRRGGERSQVVVAADGIGNFGPEQEPGTVMS
jgi:hypothetical protein